MLNNKKNKFLYYKKIIIFKYSFYNFMEIKSRQLVNK